MNKFDKVDLIAAVGRSGQLGHNGKLPWSSGLGDLQEFAEKTTNCLLVVGGNTFRGVEHLHGTRGRLLVLDSPRYNPDIAWDTATRYQLMNVFIIGGAKTYQRWIENGWIRHALITHIDYDGPADTYMPQLWRDPPKARGMMTFPDET